MTEQPQAFRYSNIHFLFLQMTPFTTTDYSNQPLQALTATLEPNHAASFYPRATADPEQLSTGFDMSTFIGGLALDLCSMNCIISTALYEQLTTDVLLFGTHNVMNVTHLT